MFEEQKQFDKAKKYYQKALTINSDHIETKCSLSLLQLTLSEFSKGFELYEARYYNNKKGGKTIPPNILTPQYQDKYLNIKGKHILIYPEQGVGDEVIFTSVLPELEAQVKQRYPYYSCL